MTANFQIFVFIVILLVLCGTAFFIYKAIGSKRIAGKIFLAVSSIVILHLLLLFLSVYDPAPASIFSYKLCRKMFRMDFLN